MWLRIRTIELSVIGCIYQQLKMFERNHWWQDGVLKSGFGLLPKIKWAKIIITLHYVEVSGYTDYTWPFSLIYHFYFPQFTKKIQVIWQFWFLSEVGWLELDEMQAYCSKFNWYHLLKRSSVSYVKFFNFL